MKLLEAFVNATVGKQYIPLSATSTRTLQANSKI